MSREEILKREKICFDILNSLGAIKYVLVGGYAVSSFEFPRFSVDLDIVLVEEETEKLKIVLGAKGFFKTEELTGFDNTYSGRFERYKIPGLPVAVDLLINSITSRQTGHSYSFDYLSKHSEIREIMGWGQDIKSMNKVPNREMLLALKINSARISDIRDIIALCYQPPDATKIFNHLKNCKKEIILSHLTRIQEFVTDVKNRDSIKGVFSLPDKPLEQMLKTCRTVLVELSDMIGDANHHSKT